MYADSNSQEEGWVLEVVCEARGLYARGRILVGHYSMGKIVMTGRMINQHSQKLIIIAILALII